MAKLEENFAAFLEWADEHGIVRASEIGVDDHTPEDGIVTAMCAFYGIEPADELLGVERWDDSYFFGADDIVAAANGQGEYADTVGVIGNVVNQQAYAEELSQHMAESVEHMKSDILNKLADGTVHYYCVCDFKSDIEDSPFYHSLVLWKLEPPDGQ